MRVCLILFLPPNLNRKLPADTDHRIVDVPALEKEWPSGSLTESQMVGSPREGGAGRADGGHPRGRNGASLPVPSTARSVRGCRKEHLRGRARAREPVRRGGHGGDCLERAGSEAGGHR